MKTLLLGLAFASAHAAACQVLDPELQASYSGPCVNGLAEGRGRASGTADYAGEFRAGRKHGHGVKTWPNGDRYSGAWQDDRRQGRGSYVFGRGAWQGERYDGEFALDRRHGAGTYRIASGDVYSGPWRDDAAVGAPTAMMVARARFDAELRKVMTPGRVVCRPGARTQWQRGVVLEANGARITVRVGTSAPASYAMADWVPCYG
jgi:hypothetical protein